jgi:hypothetical protein
VWFSAGKSYSIEKELLMRGRSGKQTYRREENETSYADGTRSELFLTSGGEATDAEYARVVLAQPYEWSEEEIRAAQKVDAGRAFRFFR